MNSIVYSPKIIWTTKIKIMHLFIIRGMDPLAFAVLCGISSGAAGFLFGGYIFNLTWMVLFNKRAKEFLEVMLYNKAG